MSYIDHKVFPQCRELVLGKETNWTMNMVYIEGFLEDIAKVGVQSGWQQLFIRPVVEIQKKKGKW